MSRFFEMTLPIDSRDVDGNGYCKASALLGHMQEAATQAAEHSGFSREIMLERYQAFWMLTRVWYQLKRPLRWDESLTIRTWHRDIRGATLYRDYDLFVDHEQVGEGVSIWVLAETQGRRLLHLGTVSELKGEHGGALCKGRRLYKIHLPQGMSCVDRRLLRYSDIDINGHVNNTRYADFACDALHMEEVGGEKFLSSLQIGYLAECKAGEMLKLCLGEEGGTLFLRGVDEDGKSRFEAAIIFSELLP